MRAFGFFTKPSFLSTMVRWSQDRTEKRLYSRQGHGQQQRHWRMAGRWQADFKLKALSRGKQGN